METRASWVVASVSLLLLGLSFGGPWITAVGLKEIASDTGGARQVPALAVSLAFFGTGVGGILMGRLAVHGDAVLRDARPRLRAGCGKRTQEQHAKAQHEGHGGLIPDESRVRERSSGSTLTLASLV